MSNTLPSVNQSSAQTPQPTSNPISQEELYSNLNKALKNSFHVIYLLVWPMGLILCWLGYNTHIRIGQIDNIKQEILDKKNDVSDMVSRIQMSQMELWENQDKNKSEQEKLTKKIDAQINEINKLGKSTYDTTRRGEGLIQKVDKARLEADTLRVQAEQSRIAAEKLLAKNQDIINGQVKFIELNKNKISTALDDVNKKNEQLVSNLKNDATKEFERNKKMVALFVQYQILVTKGRSKFPDPNMEAELKIMDQIAEILYPNVNERNAFIQQVDSGSFK